MAFSLKERGKTFEDLLATDSLFIEYFNQYLELPTFPEPLCFNRATGGFEVKSAEKRRLSREIKAAVRAGKKRKRIYRPVHNHSYSAIPLIPIEEQPYAVMKEINTSFTVQTLNKEQGIQWIKQERLPAFLLSECYMEYRLAKLISQAQAQAQAGAQAQGSKGEFVLLKLDHRPPPPPKKRDKDGNEEEEEEPKVDVGQLMLKKCYVCMGNAPTTDTESWVSQAKLTVETTTTPSSPAPAAVITPSSSSAARPPSGSGLLRPTSGTHVGRPGSSTSRGSSMTSRVADSGIWSPTKSMFSSEPTQYSSQSVYSLEEDSEEERAAAAESGSSAALPHPPRPSSSINRPSSSSVIRPFSSSLRPSSSSTTRPSSSRPSDPIFEFVDENAPATSPTSTQNGEGVTRPPPQRPVYREPVAPPEDEADIPAEELDDFDSDSDDDVELGGSHAPRSASSAGRSNVAELTKPVESPAIGDDQDSDEDVLLNSDSDYEDERDDFFHKKKERTLNLIKMRGIESFKKFLVGTSGEKNWLFWLDIERLKGIESEDELKLYLAALRERYQQSGATYELPPQTKRQLGLQEPSQWTRDKLYAAQSKMAEPLVMYWAPRFLLQQTMKTQPEKNPIYQHQKLLNEQQKRSGEVYPNPPTISLLPLRPKSCMPKMGDEAPKIQITEAFEPTESFVNHPKDIPKTTPPIGMRRTYQLPEIFQPPPDQKEEKEKENVEKRRQSKTPKQLIKPRLKARPPSAPARLGSSRTEVRPPSAGRWGSVSRPSSAAGARPGAGSRRGSVASRAEEDDDDAGSTVSGEFAGGRRMEGLLQALSNEKKSGAVMRKFLKEAGNTLWSNCLMFWEAVQEYHHMFYSQIIDSFNLQKKAKEINSRYIVAVGPRSISCTKSVRDGVHSHLVPPFEELFDAAEEYALTILFDAWAEMLASDISTFDKVELIEEKRHLDTKSNYMVTLQRRGIIKDRPETPDSNPDESAEPEYDTEALVERIPAEFRGSWPLEKLVHSRLELEHFRHFLADHYASTDLLCWMELEAFKRIPPGEEAKRDAKAREIKQKYLNKKYFFGPSSPAGKQGQEQVMAAGGGWGKLLEDRPPTPCLLEAQRYVRGRLEGKWLPLFLATDTFAARQHVLVNMDDAVEDVMIQKKKKSQAIWKMLESKWVSSSKDIITFRKALLNPVSSLQFRKYVSIKGDNFENDVLFWQEVQKYKDLCHLHSDRALVQQKTAAILHCFIDSPVPPALQVDITQDMADRILERKAEASPYLFREAQLTVFRVLFSQWADFCTFRSKLPKERLMSTLDKQKRRHRVDTKRKQRAEEEKKLKDEAKRKALGLPPSGEPLDDDYDPFSSAKPGSRMSGISTGGGDGEDGGGGGDKAAMSWSYAKYMQGLEREDVLNDVDIETYSTATGEEEERSVTSTTSGDSASDASGPTLRRARPGRHTDSSARSEKPQGKPPAVPRPYSGSGRGSQRTKASSSRGPHATTATTAR